ncbi:MAG: peptidase M48, partial [Caldimonas sp.]
YSRAKESTCDRHGRACCESPESAARALVALAAGAQRWRMVDLPTFEAQAGLSSGFWMSYHELTGGYPWLTKRVARVLHPEAPMPGRNFFAYLFALFSPYVGRGGGAAGVLVIAAVIGILAAVALPAYKDYETRAHLSSAYIGTAPARKRIADYYAEHKAAPASLEEAGVPASLPDGTQLSLDADSMVLTAETPSGELVFAPELQKDGTLDWQCSPGEGVRLAVAPAMCRHAPAK